MMLPRAHTARIDLRKLSDYCLSAHHSVGMHKARLFQSALGIGPESAVWLRDRILEGIEHHHADALQKDAFGQRYRVDVPLERLGRQAVIRTIWIVEREADAPRLVTCWVL